MGVDRLTDLLAANDMSAADVLARARPEERAELAALLSIAARARRTLKPVSPPPAFRARLHDNLMAALLQRKEPRVPAARRSDGRWGWVLGAAALGSAAGLVVVALRSRTQTQKQVQPQAHQ